MTPHEFFGLFEAELPLYDPTHKINTYYKYARKGPFYGWRRAYFLQRLEYIYEHIVRGASNETRVWDVGCGFGTSSLFLAMNGIRSIGTTLELYHRIIPERKDYWRQYGDADLFTYTAEDLFETKYENGAFDCVLVQDTLHHIEPIGDGISILRRCLKEKGKLVVVEENGGNILMRARLYYMRGNNRVTNSFDENLGRNVIMGNENVRPFRRWERILNDGGFAVADVQYIKFLPPVLMNERNYVKLIALEQKAWRRNSFLREYLFWGLNFTCTKQ